MTLPVAQAIQQTMVAEQTNKLKSMWKEVVVNYFEVVFRHLPREAEENNEKHMRIVEFQDEI
jgi:beta-lactamase class D